MADIRASRRDGRGSMVTRSMSIDDLEKLPCYDYIAKDMTSSPVDCAVCLESLNTGDKCRLLPMCKHSFHAQCVDTWLLKTPFCPICRSSAASISGSQFIVVRESQESGSSTNVGMEMRENPALGSTRQQIDTTENHMVSASTLSLANAV
ncbi:hypothetical protein PIB30_054927 [Stylosanthes scabra]|uniref:RING-type E3 ubiquitin transferase n=1 Tax=Stylosanthes scabra TaxID=79078 RepID=A0ABU6WHB8_9FABA|nr:hypothetical protein [Stylosanthes scabra]